MRLAWIAAAGAAAGCGMWATHFTGMLAYEPGVELAFRVELTVLSLIVAVAIAGIGLAVAVHGGLRWGAPLGGGLVGAAAACMHYVGMRAMVLPGDVTWSPTVTGCFAAG